MIATDGKLFLAGRDRLTKRRAIMSHHTTHIAYHAWKQAEREDGAKGAILGATGAGLATAKLLAMTSAAVPVLAPVTLPAAAVAAAAGAIWGWCKK